jgi:hypothetical protein
METEPQTNDPLRDVRLYHYPGYGMGDYGKANGDGHAPRQNHVTPSQRRGDGWGFGFSGGDAKGGGSART